MVLERDEQPLDFLSEEYTVQGEIARWDPVAPNFMTSIGNIQPHA
jgi:hypothetical protein